MPKRMSAGSETSPVTALHPMTGGTSSVCVPDAGTQTSVSTEVGTTVTAQLVAFDVGDLAMALAAAGFFGGMAARGETARQGFAACCVSVGQDHMTGVASPRR